MRGRDRQAAVGGASHILAALMFDTQSAAAKTMASMNLAPTAVRGRHLLHRDPSANQSVATNVSLPR